MINASRAQKGAFRYLELESYRPLRLSLNPLSIISVGFLLVSFHSILANILENHIIITMDEKFENDRHTGIPVGTYML
jgi:hypothetical protein